MSDQPVRPPRQRGRASSERALIEAAIACFAEVGPNDVSVRAIAERAGVNHGLVHHYFGSKAGLIQAVIEHMWTYFAEQVKNRTGMAILTSDDPLPLLSARAFTRIIVDGAMPAGQTRFPILDAGTSLLVSLGLSDEREARVISGQVLAMIMGWLLLEPWMVPAVGYAPEDAAKLRLRLQVSGMNIVLGAITAQESSTS